MPVPTISSATSTPLYDDDWAGGTRLPSHLASGIFTSTGGVSVKGTAMSSLVVIVYPNEEKAEEVRERLFELQVEHLIKIGDAVIATKTELGSVKLNQMMNMTAAGAASGSMWGLLIGVLFLNPLIGVAAGAASGALAGALTDVGINDPFMKRLAETSNQAARPCSSLCRDYDRRGLAAIKEYGGVVLKTSFDEIKERPARRAEERRRVDIALNGQKITDPGRNGGIVATQRDMAPSPPSASASG